LARKAAKWLAGLYALAYAGCQAGRTGADGDGAPCGAAELGGGLANCGSPPRYIISINCCGVHSYRMDPERGHYVLDGSLRRRAAGFAP